MGIRIVLVAPKRLVRDVLQAALSQVEGVQVIATFASAAEVLAQARSLAPDIFMLGTDLSDLSGPEVVHRLSRSSNEAKIVALVPRADPRQVREMIRAGATGCVTVASTLDDLINAIQAVAQGIGYLSADAAGALIEGVQKSDADLLTSREREVLRMIAEGVKAAEIANRLCVSVATVEVYRRNLMRKLKVRSIAELTKAALREGIVSL